MSESGPHNSDAIRIAVEQLDVALELFLKDRSCVSALTLAGAAEEILGKALPEESRALTWQYEVLGQQFCWPMKKFVSEANWPRDRAKHGKIGEAIQSESAFRGEAHEMLVRACLNFHRLGLPPSENVLKFSQLVWKECFNDLSSDPCTDEISLTS